ncbi:VWA domain-containing protein [Paludibacterium sp.]|uniref:vWA domain-containing protein n=1 Tax=Paludibacterium sp. TaxID=1917523 RepID=UPI0025FD249E|nr:VWA domain-containing protein [Paludibacterium sp.]MBV8646709.1 VWA domain-containing protein [Paludibacterium sp.]
MFIRFFLALKDAKLPVSITEYLTLMEAMKAGLAGIEIESFYHLARGCLVKDERNFDKFDRVFGAYFQGMEDLFAAVEGEIPEEWLKALKERVLSEEEKAAIEALGGWDTLMETLRKRLEEQKERHEGGSKWIGTAGTSPFGAHGYHPEGVRIGQAQGRNRRAVKVWDRREFRNYDDKVELGTRTIKIALRRLRRWAREGAETELDLAGTIAATARNAGSLDLKLVPERHNKVKVLLCLDVGGSMDDHIRVCDELFSAARSEFKHLEHYYFHNCPYERLWRDNVRRQDAVDSWNVLRLYPSDYKLIFVGDAAMSPYEILEPGGSVEHWNKEAGAVWLQRFVDQFPNAVWLNPTPEQHWRYTSSTELIQRLMKGRMFPLTLAGLDSAMKILR